MQKEANPKCPKCGGTHVKKITRDRDDSGILRLAGMQTTRVVAYKCDCGCGFTITIDVKDDQAKSGP